MTLISFLFDRYRVLRRRRVKRPRSASGSPIRPAAILRVEHLEPRTLLSSVTWTGHGDGQSWSNPANWSSNPGLPGPSDDVVIGPGQTVKLDASETIGSLEIEVGGTLDMAAGNSLTVGNNVTNQGTIEMYGDFQELTVGGGTGQFLNSGTVSYAPGSKADGMILADMTNTGTIYDDQGWLDINSEESASGLGGGSFPGTFTNTGTINVAGNGFACYMVTIGGMAGPSNLGTSLIGDGTIVIIANSWTLNTDWTLPATTAELALEGTITGTNLVVPKSDILGLGGATLSFNIEDYGTLVAFLGNTLTGTLTVEANAVLAVGNPSDAKYPNPDDAPPPSSVVSLTVAGNVTNNGTIALFNACTGHSFTVNGIMTNSAGGTIASLYGSESDGKPNILNANIDNEGTISVSGANFTISGAPFSFSGANVAINQGTDYSTNTVTINGQGSLQGDATLTLEIGGSLLGNTTNMAAFSEPGTVIFDGNGTVSSPQLLELMEPDQLDVSAGYTSNLAFGTLQLGAGTYVKLVDQFQNSPSNGKAEAGYANLLIVPTGSTFDRGGLNFYAKTSQIGTNLGVYSGGYWYLNVNGKMQVVACPAGWSGATPVVGDWNGDGKSDIGLFLNGNWWLDTNEDGVFDSGDAQFIFGFGGSGVVPVVGDWNGGGKTEVGVYANGAWFRDVDGTHTWDATNQAALAYLGWNDNGTNTVIPVPGQWAGDGKTEMGVYCQGVWFLDSTDSNKWDGGHTYWGWAGSLIPVVGNWTGSSAKSQFGVYNQGAWFLDFDNSQTWDAVNQAALTYFGWAGALPAVGNWGSGFAGAAQATSSVRPSRLAASQLQPAVSEAISGGAAAGEGVPAAAIPAAEFLATEPPGGDSAPQSGNIVQADAGAAGPGQLADPTPASDAALGPTSLTTQLPRLDPQAVDRIDLAAAVKTALGHGVGLRV